MPAAETCTALYDFEAQSEGDLSFLANDTIEIITRTQNENEWWTGKVRGKQGQFPGTFQKNYYCGGGELGQELTVCRQLRQAELALQPARIAAVRIPLSLLMERYMHVTCCCPSARR
jgi:hypothetical protein